MSGGMDPYGNDYLYSVTDWTDDMQGALEQTIINLILHVIMYLLTGVIVKKVLLTVYLRNRGKSDIDRLESNVRDMESVEMAIKKDVDKEEDDETDYDDNVE